MMSLKVKIARLKKVHVDERFIDVDLRAVDEKFKVRNAKTADWKVQVRIS